MITSRTVEHNSDRTYDISIILLSRNEENDQKVGFRDLKCRNEAQNWNLREKLSKTGLVEIFWLWSKSTVKVNGLRVLTWQCNIILGLTWQYVKWSKCVECVWAHGTGVWGAWARERDRNGAWSACSQGKNFRWCVSSSFWPFLVGFCSGLAVLSLYAFAFTIGWAERWYPRVIGTVGVPMVTCFCQWLLDKGEGSGRMPEMSTGTRKSEEWLWYHVKNIKWERKTE